MDVEEEADFNIEATIKFKTNVHFSKMLRGSRLELRDAWWNFMGHGLDHLIDSGEYDCEIIDSKITKVE